MICAASPEWDDASETVCTLKFASRVRGTAVGPAAPARSDAPVRGGALRELSSNRPHEPAATAGGAAKAKAKAKAVATAAAALTRFR